MVGGTELDDVAFPRGHFVEAWGEDCSNTRPQGRRTGGEVVFDRAARDHIRASLHTSRNSSGGGVEVGSLRAAATWTGASWTMVVVVAGMAGREMEGEEKLGPLVSYSSL